MKKYSQSRKGKLAWAFEELQIFHNAESEQPAEDFTAVYLESPDVVEGLKHKLDEILNHSEYILKQQGFRFSFDLRPQIEMKYRLNASRSVTIQIEDLKYISEPGYCTPASTQLTITLDAEGGGVHSDSWISFPSSISFDQIRLIMKNTDMCNPEMSFSSDASGKEFISISFESGYGVSSSSEEAAQTILCLLYNHLHFMTVAREAVADPSGTPGIYGVIEAVNLLAERPEAR
ncbi:hypothetical protein P0Y35_08690 [Kiritimatiellaeota bacterium B1221]|nr:hypothetical protein [Kiritimatiellaeota bacterium B1221]